MGKMPLRLRLTPGWALRLFATRHCPADAPGRTCPEYADGFHTHHLTAFGRWIFS